MSARNIASTCLLTFLTFTLFSGCGKKSDQTTSRMNAADQLQTKAMTLYREGNTNAAIEVLDEALSDNKTDPESKPYILSSLINLLLECGQVDKAEKTFMTVADTTPGLLNNSLGRIMQFHQHNNDQNALSAWCYRLIDMNLPENFRLQALSHLLIIHHNNDQLDIALSLINNRAASFSPAACSQMIKGLIYHAITAENYAGAEEIIAAGDKFSSDNADLQSIIKIAHIDVCFGRKQWDEGAKQLKAAAAQLKDNDFASLTARALSTLNKNGQSQAADALCVYIIQNHKDLVKTCAKTMYIYLNNVNDNPVEAVARLTFLDQSCEDRRAYLNLYQKDFYTILATNNKDLLQQMLVIADKLSKQLDNENGGPTVRLLMLDLTFILEDYATSIELLKEGIPGRDEEWMAHAMDKMEAHMALQNGQHKKAIEHFRSFMARIAEQKENESDPTTGIVHTKEMILGLNAKRIGDIYLSINDKTEAAKAYEEAYLYYTKAKESVDIDNKGSHGIIDNAMVTLAEARKALSLN